MSLLSIIQEAAGSLNQPPPAAIFGSTTGDAVLWRNLAQREGRELARRHDWQVLTTGANWTTIAAALQTGAITSAFDHFVPGAGVWNVTLGMRYQGPADNPTWEAITVLGLTPSPAYWRLLGGNLYIAPAPTAGQTGVFLYVSKNWCQSSGAVPQNAWAADTDTALIPENLISLGLTWRWLRSKGMDYAEEMETYEREVEKATARDRGIAAITAGGRGGDYDSSPTWAGVIVV